MATEQLEDLEIVEETPPITPTEQEEKTWSAQSRPSCQVCRRDKEKPRPFSQENA